MLNLNGAGAGVSFVSSFSFELRRLKWSKHPRSTTTYLRFMFSPPPRLPCTNIKGFCKLAVHWTLPASLALLTVRDPQFLP